MYETFDIISYLDAREIEYWEHGKNVTRGWTNIMCPFPDCSDSSNHCGISPTRFFHCWACGRKGIVTKLVQAIEECSWAQANASVEKYQEEISDVVKDIRRTEKTRNKGPTTSIKHRKYVDLIPGFHKNYLRGRNFNPEQIISQYKLKAIHDLENRHWKFRLVAPIFLNRKIMNLIGLDITKNPDREPYMALSNEDAILPLKHLLYNLDNAKGDSVVLVEGITDVWRMGPGFVASFGNVLTVEQMQLLVSKNFKKYYIFYDATAIKNSERVANQFSGLPGKVEIIELSEGDPCDLSELQVYDLRRGLQL